MCGGVFCNACTKYRSAIDHHENTKKKRVCYSCMVAITKDKYKTQRAAVMASAMPVKAVQANMQAKKEDENSTAHTSGAPAGAEEDVDAW